MQTISNPIQSLAANLGAFMINGAAINPIPGVIVDGQVQFVAAPETSVLEDGQEIKTLGWRELDVAPSLTLLTAGVSQHVGMEGYAGIDRSLKIFGSWRELKELSRRMSKGVEDKPDKKVRSLALQSGRAAAEQLAKSRKLRGELEAAARLSESMQHAADQISWRAVASGAGAVSEASNDPAAVEKYASGAAAEFVKSGVLYHLVGASAESAGALYQASDILRSIGSYNEAAIWAETASDMRADRFGEESRFVTETLLRGAKGEAADADKAFILSLALQRAWAGKFWDLYADGMGLLAASKEKADDFVGVGVCNFLMAWALLQGSELKGLEMGTVAKLLGEAEAAWMLVDEDEKAGEAGRFAQIAESIRSH